MGSNLDDLKGAIRLAESRGFSIVDSDEEFIKRIAQKGRATCLMVKQNRWHENQLHFYRCNYTDAMNRYITTDMYCGHWRIYLSKKKFNYKEAICL